MADKSNRISFRKPTQKELPDVRELRYTVLDEPIGVPRKTTPSDKDSAKNVIHLAAFDGDNLVCTVRLDDLGDKRYLVRRMATSTKYRGQGIGKKVLRAAETEARKLGAISTILHSRQSAVGFYQKQGYSLTGGVEIHNGDENLEMVKDL